jgi:hypothetical protein
MEDILESYTTAIIMPGCELSAYTLVENAKALIDSARLSSAP